MSLGLEEEPQSLGLTYKIRGQAEYILNTLIPCPVLGFGGKAMNETGKMELAFLVNPVNTGNILLAQWWQVLWNRHTAEKGEVKCWGHILERGQLRPH